MRIFLSASAVFLMVLTFVPQLSRAQEKDDLDQAFAACMTHRHFDDKTSDTVFDQGWESCKTINEKWSPRNYDRWVQARAAAAAAKAAKAAAIKSDDEPARQKMLGVANGLKENH